MDSKKMVDSVENKTESAQTFFDNSKWLSTKDAAIYLRKFRRDGTPSVGAIRNLIWRGFLKAHKWHRRVYILRKDLDRLILNSPTIEGGFEWA